MMKFKIAGLNVDKAKHEIYLAIRKHEEDAEFCAKMANALRTKGLCDVAESYYVQANKQRRRALNARQILAIVCKAHPQVSSKN